MQTIHQVLISVNRGETTPQMALCDRTKGVLSIDLEEILAWAKNFQVPPDGRFDVLNLFFHHLPSGSYAVGRLLPAMGTEQKRKARIRSFYLQYMIVDPETFLSFGNNPVFLYQEILSSGQLPFMSRQTSDLEPILLNDVRKWFDPQLVKGMTVYPGAVPIASLAQTVLHSLSSLLTGGPPPIHVISTLFNLFPIRFRPELTFSAGLYFTPDRYFRLIGVSKKNPRPASIRDFCPVPYLNLDHLAAQPELSPPQKGWGRLIAEVLESGRFDYFQTRLMEYDLNSNQDGNRDGTFFIPSAEELDNLGDRWFDDLKRLKKGENAAAVPSKSQKPLGSIKRTKKREISDLDDEDSFGEIFRLKKRRGSEENPPLSISEKLRRWLLANDLDETLLHFRDRKDSSDSETVSSETESNPGRPQRLSPPPKRPQLGHDGIENREQLSYEEPLLAFMGRNRLFSPFQRLIADLPEWENDLLELDSQVAHALRGDYQSVENLIRFWNRFKDRVDGETEWSVREEYIHFIQIILTFNGCEDEIQSPQKRMAALDVLDLFLNEGEPSEFFSRLD